MKKDKTFNEEFEESYEDSDKLVMSMCTAKVTPKNGICTEDVVDTFITEIYANGFEPDSTETYFAEEYRDIADEIDDSKFNWEKHLAEFLCDIEGLDYDNAFFFFLGYDIEEAKKRDIAFFMEGAEEDDPMALEFLEYAQDFICTKYGVNLEAAKNVPVSCYGRVFPDEVGNSCYKEYIWRVALSKSHEISNDIFRVKE